VAVMYLGRIVERGQVQEVLRTPRHPYTQALLSAVPRVDAQGQERLILQGDMPSPANPPSGCHFHPRCPRATADCAASYPQETRLSETHGVRCFLAGAA
jgi:peptide/nickel transport system ATP-binding protein